MIAALRYEWVRITTVRTTLICLILAPLFGALIAFLSAAPPVEFDPNTGTEIPGPVALIPWYESFANPIMLTTILAVVIAAQSIGQEYRFGLIRLTLTAFPQRLRILVAKLVVVSVAAVAIALLSYAGSWIGVALRGYPTPPEGVFTPDSGYLVRGVLYVVMVALSAFAVAGITRVTALGIAIPIVSGFIAEQILGALLRQRADWLVQVLPWSTAARWSQTTREQFPGDVVYSVGWAALGTFAVWLLLFLVLEVLSFLRRDA